MKITYLLRTVLLTKIKVILKNKLVKTNNINQDV